MSFNVRPFRNTATVFGNLYHDLGSGEIGDFREYLQSFGDVHEMDQETFLVESRAYLIRGDTAALDRIIRGHICWIVPSVRKRRNRGVPMVDMMQEGVCILIDALKTYDVSRGVPFKNHFKKLLAVWLQHMVYRETTSTPFVISSQVNSDLFHLRHTIADDFPETIPTTKELFRAIHRDDKSPGLQRMSYRVMLSRLRLLGRPTFSHHRLATSFEGGYRSIEDEEGTFKDARRDLRNHLADCSEELHGKVRLLLKELTELVKLVDSVLDRTGSEGVDQLRLYLGGTKSIPIPSKSIAERYQAHLGTVSTRVTLQCNLLFHGHVDILELRALFVIYRHLSGLAICSVGGAVIDRFASSTLELITDRVRSILIKLLESKAIATRLSQCPVRQAAIPPDPICERLSQLFWLLLQEVEASATELVLCLNPVIILQEKAFLLPHEAVEVLNKMVGLGWIYPTSCLDEVTSDERYILLNEDSASAMAEQDTLVS